MLGDALQPGLESRGIGGRLGADERGHLAQSRDRLVLGFPGLAALEPGLQTGAARDGLQARLKGSKPGEAKDKAIAGLRQVSALLAAKAPADAAAFKSWLQSISQHTAEAAKEGGFLGFGGVQVSDAEKATLGEISGVLKA